MILINVCKIGMLLWTQLSRDGARSKVTAYKPNRPVSSDRTFCFLHSLFHLTSITQLEQNIHESLHQSTRTIQQQRGKLAPFFKIKILTWFTHISKHLHAAQRKATYSFQVIINSLDSTTGSLSLRGSFRLNKPQMTWKKSGSTQKIHQVHQQHHFPPCSPREEHHRSIDHVRSSSNLNITNKKEDVQWLKRTLDSVININISPVHQSFSRIDFFLISSLDKIYYQLLLVITAVTFSLHNRNTRWSFNTSQLQLQYGKQQKAVLRGINISFSVLKQKKERTRSWKSNNTISLTQGIQERKPRTNDFKKTEFLRCRLRRE